MAEYDINFDFIASLEGGQKLDGYVPECTPKSVINTNNKACYGKDAGSAIGVSGVTISSGFDLGQQSEGDLKKYHLPPDLIKKLKPYLGKRKEKAQHILQSQPLSISSTEARLIDMKIKDAIAHQLQHNFKSKFKVDFFSLPKEAQTAAFSFYYQNGWKRHDKNAMDFYKSIADKKWEEAINTLNKFDSYKSRRQSEADLLTNLPMESKPIRGDFPITSQNSA